LDLNLRKKLVKCCISSISLYGADTWTLCKVYQKYLESFKYRAEKGWRRSVGPILWEIRKYYKYSMRIGRMANWIGYILRRNCLLKRIIPGKIDGGIYIYIYIYIYKLWIDNDGDTSSDWMA
jgi:hypothetical protein